MRFNGSKDACSSSLRIRTQRETRWAPVAGVAGSTAALMLLAVVFLFLRYRKRGLRGAESVQEEHRADPSHGDHTPSPPVEPQFAAVAAFALKARVVYPINQRFRVSPHSHTRLHSSTLTADSSPSVLAISRWSIGPIISGAAETPG
ncbi:hypothetical protein DNTS_010114 [Danionella cerebrum]|uniref:Uncharacterized protein n=1 Tax=Danionella cerebrum TaxID=2873325 RepID=A0A553MM52_9TELE|nr:hypothetical protein DNTS_010114 [Danionella translucida]